MLVPFSVFYSVVINLLSSTSVGQLVVSQLSSQV